MEDDRGVYGTIYPYLTPWLAEVLKLSIRWSLIDPPVKRGVQCTKVAYVWIWMRGSK
jgi:hypothetical protein